MVWYSLTATLKATAQAKKPNILVIWGDDIGMWNVGAYSLGMMGKTFRISRDFSLRIIALRVFSWF
jgi:hypothetical protein